ncbi:deoxyribonuclease gamma [Echinops telfairi]|uniref:Deoxyribonuclease n=1 Tax=Echinops telfairi TaxID=9371 RepID=A0ABM0ZQC7_ECHTE|nr:deoxyribonuclease gamma [Echinops telfairi]
MSPLLPPLLLLLLSTQDALALRICSFNVRSFGESKKEDQNTMDVIVKTEKAQWIQGSNSRRGTTYNYVISSRLGRNTYKEQYAFLYKEKLVSVKRSYLYRDDQDGDEDVFSREPFVVWFQSPHTAVKDFVIIPLHTTPETSVKEIDELVDVYMEVKERWKTENFVFMGDFNAGCSYVRKKAWKNIRLRTDSRFVWLIRDGEDTTVKESTHCAYDRIVLRGPELVGAVVPDSSGIFNFQEAYKLTEEEALAVSDHFPVEFRLQTSRVITSNKKAVPPKKKKTRRS